MKVQAEHNNRYSGMRAARLALSLLGLIGCAQPSATGQAAGQATATTAPAAAPEVTIALVGTSDLHGYVEPRVLTVQDATGAKQQVTRGGLALLAGYLDNLRRKYPVLLLDAGDLFQGTLVSNLGEGQAVIEAYNQLHYDAAAVGNHEFDYGPVGPPTVPNKPEDDPTGALEARIASAKFPFLAANILDKKTGKPVTWANTFPSRKLIVAGVPIGVIGAITEDTTRTTNTLNLRDVEIGPVLPAVREQAQALRQQGVAAVVLVVHEGANCVSFNNPRDASACENNDERVVTMVRQLGGAVDAVVGGHSHAGMAHFVGDVPVIQSFAMGQAFGRMDLVFQRSQDPKNAAGFVLDKTRTRIYPPTEMCSVALPPPSPTHPAQPAAESAPNSDGVPGTTATRMSWRCDAKLLAGTTLKQNEYEGQALVPSAAMTTVLTPHIDKAAARRASPLGVTLKTRLRRNYRNESPLGVLLADLIRTGSARVAGVHVDFAFQNGGGIRNELPAGPLTYGHLFEVLPFDNRLALLRMTGKNLLDLYLGNLQGSHGVLVPSGLTVEANCVGGQLAVTLRGLDGKPLDPAKTYTIAVSDFLASGGDNFGAVLATMPPGSVKYYDNVMLREVVQDELRTYRGPLLTGQEGAEPPRLKLSMPRPMKCQ
jgi:5'-nucleotidase